MINRLAAGMIVGTLVLAACEAATASPDGDATPTSATGATDPASPEAPSGCQHGADGKCRVVMTTSFVGNDWRVQMVRGAEAVAAKEPFASAWDFSLVTTDNSAEAQNALIENLLAEGVDGLLIDAYSDTSANEVIKTACEQGVAVVTFDVVATAGACDVSFILDFYDVSVLQGELMGQALDCTGEVILDRGLQGASIANEIYEGWLEGLENACGDGVQVVGDFYSEWNEALQEPALSALLAANPSVEGASSQVSCITMESAFENAGQAFPVARCPGSNANFVLCAENAYDCIVVSNTPAVSIGAMDAMYDILAGQDVPKELPYPIYTHVTAGLADITVDGLEVEVIELGVNAFPELPPGFQPAYEWKGAKVNPTLSEVTSE